MHCNLFAKWQEDDVAREPRHISNKHAYQIAQKMGEIFKLRLLLDAVRPFVRSSQPPACARSRSSLSPEMIVAKIFAINKVAGCRKDDRARDAHAIQNTIVRF